MRVVLRRVAAATGLMRVVFRLREFRRAREGPRVPSVGPDGLPLPSRSQMIRVTNNADWRANFESGAAQAAVFADLAETCGVALNSASAVLDWGCGCGRVTRHLSKFTSAQIFGRDIDRNNIRWAARNLPGDFKVSRHRPPLDLADASVDVALSLSVFTHIGMAAQHAWLAELARVIRPGGLLLLTFMDEEHPGAADAGVDREKLRSTGFAVNTSALEGTNYMATFQTRDQLSAVARPHFREVIARRSGETALQQAVIGLVRQDGQRAMSHLGAAQIPPQQLEQRTQAQKRRLKAAGGEHLRPSACRPEQGGSGGWNSGSVSI